MTKKKKEIKTMRTRRTTGTRTDSPTASKARAVRKTQSDRRAMNDATIPCARCGRDGVAVWKACADKDWRVLCDACDVEANQMLLAFLKVPQPTRRINRYRLTMDLRPVTRSRMMLCGMLSLDGSTLR